MKLGFDRILCVVLMLAVVPVVVLHHNIDNKNQLLANQVASWADKIKIVRGEIDKAKAYEDILEEMAIRDVQDLRTRFNKMIESLSIMHHITGLNVNFKQDLENKYINGKVHVVKVGVDFVSDSLNNMLLFVDDIADRLPTSQLISRLEIMGVGMRGPLNCHMLIDCYVVYLH